MAEAKPETSDDDKIVIAKDGKLNPGGSAVIDGEPSAERLLANYETQIGDIRARSQVWQRHLDDYTALKGTLATISDNVVHSPAMVPLGKKAYMEGKLVHTNEITVLLGDNWFAERSALQAGDVAQRRIDRCTEMLEKLDKELSLIQGWREKAETTGSGEGEVDIREPYDAQAEAAWKEEHKKRVSNYKRALSSSTSQNEQDDEELFRRLDELEIEEELDEHLAREEEKKKSGGGKQPSPGERLLSEQEKSCDDSAIDEPGEEEELADEDKCDREGEDEEDWSESPPLSDEEDQESGSEEGEEEETDSGAVSADPASSANTTISEYPTQTRKDIFNQLSDNNQSVAKEVCFQSVPPPPPSQGGSTSRTSPLRHSRFSVSEVSISEKEELKLEEGKSSMTRSATMTCSSQQEKLRRDHVAQLKPRKRRVSFGSISERLFMKDESTSLAGKGNRSGPSIKPSSPISAQNDTEVYATITSCGSVRGDGASLSAPVAKEVSFGQSSTSTALYREPDSPVTPPSAADSGASPSTPTSADVPTIFFSHHSEGSRGGQGQAGSAGKVPTDPSDFVRLYGGAGSPTRLKSILKPSGSSHSLSSFEEELSTPSTLSGRFSVSPCKNSATTSPSRFTISPTAVTASANSTSQANSCRQLTSPSTNRFSVQAVKTTSSTDPSSEVAEKQQQPRIETLDHPVKDSVVESSDGSRVSKEANQGAAACSTSSSSSESGKRKPSRFKLSRVQ